MHAIDDYKKTGKEIYDLLRLNTYPVALKYIKDPDSIPQGFARPSQFGVKMSICQAITSVRRNSSYIAITFEDNFCVPGSYAQGWLPQITRDEFINSQRLNLWHKDLESELRVQDVFDADFMSSEGIHKINGNIGVLAAPLGRVPFIPDSIMFYGIPGQMHHLVQALAYEGKHVVKSAFIGFAESCFKGALVPYVTGKPQFVLPGSGDQGLSGTSEYEVAIGIPGELLFYIKENIFKTGGPYNSKMPLMTVIPNHLNEKFLPGWEYLKKRVDECDGKN